MKIFSWMRNKRNAKDATTKPNPDHTMQGLNKEEFSDWPNGLLAIGTFGNSDLKHPEDHLKNATPDNYEEVDKQLMRLLLDNHISLDSNFPGEPGKQNDNLSVDNLLECLRETEEKSDGELLERSVVQRSSSLCHRQGGNDIRSEKKRSGITKKSLSFLLNKVFVCGGGFVPAPILKDPPPLPDPKFNNSIMEKILRAMVHKKIYPQRPTPNNNTSTKYLDMGESDKEECDEDDSHKSKWVKTDSEYIVLEI